jgi:hypothetical protein
MGEGEEQLVKITILTSLFVDAPVDCSTGASFLSEGSIQNISFRRFLNWKML